MHTILAASWLSVKMTWPDAYTEDAEELLKLLAAGVALRIRSCRGSLSPILEERGPNGERITLGLAKAILRAGPRDEAVCLNGNALDCRRANWRLDHTGAIRVWNSKLLGVEAVRGLKKPA